MNVKEKLTELLGRVQQMGVIYKENQMDERYPIIEQIRNTEVAARLIAYGVTVQEWISVEDRLPDNKEHDWVLAQVVEDNGFMHIPKVMEYRQSRNDWFEETYGWLSEHNGAFTVTHWMPLPQPPKGE